MQCNMSCNASKPASANVPTYLYKRFKVEYLIEKTGHFKMKIKSILSMLVQRTSPNNACSGPGWL